MPEMDIRPSSPTLTLPPVAGKIREVSLPLFSAVSCSPPCDVLHALVNSTVEEMAISPVLTPGTPLIYHIKQSIAKKSARFSAKLSSRHNRGGASHAPGTPLIYHIKQSIAKKSARFSAKLSSRYNRGWSVPRSRLAFYLSYQAKHCEEVGSPFRQISSGHNQPAAARR